MSYRMSRRVPLLVAALLLLAPQQLFAQAGATEVGFRISSSQFDDTTESDEEGEVLLEFNEDLGYGVALNHFWTNSFSTEFAVDRLGGDLDVTFDDIVTLKLGEFDLTMYSANAQWHFRRAARVSPYVGVGAAYFSGRFDILLEEEVEDEELDVENELTWMAIGGVNVQLSDRVSLLADARYAPYQPEVSDAEPEEEDESIDVNPLILSAGIRFRF